MSEYNDIKIFQDSMKEMEEAVYTWNLDEMKKEWLKTWKPLPKGEKPWYLNWKYGIPRIEDACCKCGRLNINHNCNY